MIRVEQLSCGYTNTILRNISFESLGNLVILGANGVGKSTLAKAICGLIPYKGSIFVNEMPLENYTSHERAKQITYIPPKLSSFDAYLTAEAFVLMGRFPHKSVLSDYSQHDKEFALSLLKKSGIDSHKNISELSSGQQQLLLIAQALAQESHTIIFDEPTANLDPKHSYQFYKTLQDLPQDKQKILITHDLQFAAALDYPVLFVHHDHVDYFEMSKTFFTSENLQKYYGVAFEDSKKVGIVYE